MKVAVIGSGLAAISVLKILSERGIKPTVLDVGENLDTTKKAIVDRLASLEPEAWDSADRESIAENPSLNDPDTGPRKLAFGSDYFYGRSLPEAPLLAADGLIPPLSYAEGGLSVGWGAAILPPDDCDLADWPIGNSELAPYYSKVLQGLPYSAVDDGLSVAFPLLKQPANALQLSPGNRFILEKLDASRLLNRDQLVFGQSRLLVQPPDPAGAEGCKYCGYCMSGCVYGYIYKASQDLAKLKHNGLLEYCPDVLVTRLEETGDRVNLSVVTKNGSRETRSFDRVFVAAGALNSTRLLLESKRIYNQRLLLKSTGGFIAPLFSPRRFPLSWPHENTQPSIFLEFKVAGFSNHWMHTQISTPNELVLEKLGIKATSKGILSPLRKRVAEHLLIAHCNIHSEHMNGYELYLAAPSVGKSATLTTQKQTSDTARQAVHRTARALFTIARRMGCLLILPAMLDGTRSVSFHVGGTLPMRRIPETDTETDLLGRPKGWNLIHFVDSSIFTSIPGTTIGLLAMANAARIASEVEF